MRVLINALQQLAERVTKLAHQTHKDRVHEFNSKLEALSEHHDIPKVCGSLWLVEVKANECLMSRSDPDNVCHTVSRHVCTILWSLVKYILRQDPIISLCSCCCHTGGMCLRGYRGGVRGYQYGPSRITVYRIFAA